MNADCEEQQTTAYMRAVAISRHYGARGPPAEPINKLGADK
jgi:hypothetical protein